MTDHHPWNRPTGDNGEAMPALPPLPGLPGSGTPPLPAEPGLPQAAGPEPQDGAPQAEVLQPDGRQSDASQAEPRQSTVPLLGGTQPDAPHSDAPQPFASQSDAPPSNAPHNDAPHSDAPQPDAPHSDVPHSEAQQPDASQPATRAEARERLRAEASQQHRPDEAVETPWSSAPWGGPAQAPDAPPRIDTKDAPTAQQVWPPREALEWEPTFAAGGHGDYADYARTDEVGTHPDEAADAEHTDWTHAHADQATADASAAGWEPEPGTQPAHDASDHPWAQHAAVGWSQSESATDAGARSGSADAGHAGTGGDPGAGADGDPGANGSPDSTPDTPTGDAWSYSDSAPAASPPPKRRRRILIGAIAAVVVLAVAGGAIALQAASGQLKYSLGASSDIASASVEFTAPKSWSERESESFAQSWNLDDGCRFSVTHERFEDLPSLAPNDDHSPRSNIGRPANDAEATRKIALEWLELESHGDFLVSELEPRFGVATSSDGANEPLEFALYRADTPDTSRFVAVRAFNESTTALVVVMTCPDDRPLEYGEFAANLDALSFRLEPKGK